MTAAVVREFRLVLSLPPSANHLFNSRTGRRGQPIRVRSDAYDAWIAFEGYRQRWERLSEDPANGIRWRTAIVAYGLPDPRDVDNCIKPVVDLICRFTGLRDCWPHRKVSAERADDPIGDGEEPWLVVTVEVLGEGDGRSGAGAGAATRLRGAGRVRRAG